MVPVCSVVVLERRSYARFDDEYFIRGCALQNDYLGLLIRPTDNKLGQLLVRIDVCVAVAQRPLQQRRALKSANYGSVHKCRLVLYT